MQNKKLWLLSLILIFTLSACQNDDSAKGKEEPGESNTATEQNENQTNDNQEDSQKQNQQENQDDEKQEEESNEQENNEKNIPDRFENEVPDENGIITVLEPKATDIVVNKKRKLPDGYVPPNLVYPDIPFSFDEKIDKRKMRKVAAGPIEELFKGAEEAGIDLVAVSGYRSYATQKAIFNRNVQQNGEEHAKMYSAMPGHSEHQTGLTMDVSTVAVTFQLVEDFRETEEGAWLAKHAHEYGFIIRYPKGKEDITGYAYEPWHIRYVGKEMATEIYEQQLTLEEYFNLYPN
ncbi:M15 family metallopeptidase [Salinibacillus xinjiangensis]|uniref:D-alanyl-D-alanine carboxypeptidase family protein n=1 Tax=Salinibacillus xinjiangensis TaxID=1229268 RepID=A0A6G1X7J0_9BACI|nr:M15 family metallopeptidase [Salinibacillus xinjiangensis]MRG86899.1 D-alanyl-D-alanine carboxypeptidase family protein [Salinibacillus xinjiangensis]